MLLIYRQLALDRAWFVPPADHPLPPVGDHGTNP
jgi:hypothetical protein